MQVTHISFSKTGGAGRVAEALMRQQNLEGNDSTLLTLTATNLWREPTRFPGLTINAATDQYLVRNNRFPTQFSVVRNLPNRAKIDYRSLVGRRNIHLHWLEGLIDYQALLELKNSGTNFVWTLHDMAPFTGGCHHSFDCLAFSSDCSACPQVRKVFQVLPKRHLQQKIQQQELYDGIQFVAPSNWLAERARGGALLRNSDVTVIRNPIAPEFFTIPKKSFEQELAFCVVANDLQDKNKNTQLICDAFVAAQKLTDKKLRLTLIGQNGNRFISSANNIFWVQPESTAQLISVLDESQVIISASNAESFSLAIAEAQARGLKAIVRANTAAIELVPTDEFGLIFESDSDLSNAILRLVAEPPSSQAVEKIIEFSLLSRPEHITARYSDLYLA